MRIRLLSSSAYYICMKSLKDFIENYGFECGLRINARASQLIDYFGVLPEGFEENPYKDWILEALNTHDRDKLQKALNKEFGINNFKYPFGKEPYKAFQFHYEPTWNIDIEELIHIFDFYGWYVSEKSNQTWTIAPRFTKNMKDYIQDVCKDHVYHICLTKDLESILKNGVRIKTGRGSREGGFYRAFPKRIYLIAADPHDVGKAVKEVMKETGKGVFEPEYYSIIRADELSGDIYADDFMKSDHAFFTYTNIPAKNIVKSWNLEEFLDKYCGIFL